jgi:1-deoxy-D-xylulose-5-phosphate reductoisomerase
VVLNGANDVAVAAYLEEHISFADIPRVITETVQQHTLVAHPSLEETLTIDAWARKTAEELILQWSPR